MHPESLHLHHRRTWCGDPEEHAISVFVNLQFHIGFQPESISERFRNDDSARLINFYIHTI